MDYGKAENDLQGIGKQKGSGQWNLCVIKLQRGGLFRKKKVLGLGELEEDRGEGWIRTSHDPDGWKCHSGECILHTDQKF